MGVDVVKLQEGLLGASPSVGSHEGALASILAPDHTLHGTRGLARARFIRSGTDNGAAPRLLGDPELLVLDLLQHEPHRALEYGGGVTIGDLAPKERLEAAKLVVGLLVDGELDAVTLRGGRLDDGPRRREECAGDGPATAVGCEEE